MVRHKIAEGNTSEIFEISEGKVLKLFKAGYPKSTAYHEYSNHDKVSRVISNTPRLFEFIEADQRYGFIMEKMQVEHRDIDIYIEVIRNVRRHEIYS